MPLAMGKDFLQSSLEQQPSSLSWGIFKGNNNQCAEHWG